MEGLYLMIRVAIYTCYLSKYINTKIVDEKDDFRGRICESENRYFRTLSHF